LGFVSEALLAMAVYVKSGKECTPIGQEAVAKEKRG